MMLTIRRTPEQQTDLDLLLAEQQDPSSPNYHKWLAPEEFADRFGASPNDVVALRQWLESQGFQIKAEARSRTFIRFDGTAEQVQRAFGTQIHRYLVKGAVHFANASEPSMPTALAPLVLAVMGMDDFFPPRNPIRTSNGSVPATPDYLLSGNRVLAPADLATIYDTNPFYTLGVLGLSQTVVIIGSSNVSLSDTALYRTTFNLPAGLQIQRVYPDGDPGLGAGTLEATLDLEMVSALAPLAQLVLDTDASNPITWAAVSDAVDNARGEIISMSWADCEAAAPIARVNSHRYTAQEANAKNITLIASSGDWGAAACDTQTVGAAQGGLAVGLPAAFPEVTGVGGTEFVEGNGSYWSPSGSATSYIPETAWNDTKYGGLSATGGGKSSLLCGSTPCFPTPNWQTWVGVPANGTREVPDVSLAASGYHDPFAYAYNGSLQANAGGTSFSAPLFAGMIALLNSSVSYDPVWAGNINTLLYAKAGSNAFHDITAPGNNIVPCVPGSKDCPSTAPYQFGYTAGPGYDPVTGLGSVDAYNLLPAWASFYGPTAAISGLVPSATTACSASFNLTVNGQSFAPISWVSFNGAKLPKWAASDSFIQVTVPANAVTSPGTVSVEVSNPGTKSSNVAQFQIQPGPPSSPAPLSPANGATGVSLTPTLTWNAACGAKSYDVFFGTASPPNYFASTILTSYPFLSTLPGGTTYNWYIRAKNDTGSAASPTTSSFTTLVCAIPTISVQPAGQTINSGQSANLSVTASGTQPLSYQWYQGNSGDTSAPIGTNSASFSTGPLTATTSYWGLVTSACGSTVNSNTAIVTVQQSTATITVQANPSNGGTVGGGGTYPVGSQQQISASSNSGWSFTGWSDGNTQNPRTVTVPSGGATYTANFQQSTATITVQANPSNGGTVGGGGTYPVGSQQQISASPNSGWSFTSWSDGNTQNPRTITVPSGGATYTANFQQSTATITVQPNPSNGGTVGGGGAYPVGSQQQISASPNSGWSFTGWSDGNTQNPRTVTVPSGGATYTANFQQSTATITMQASPSNGGTVGGGGTYPVGSQQQISASPNSGWSFTSWSDGNTQNPRTITVPSGGATYTANFSAMTTYALTVVNGSGSGLYTAGTVVSISANPPPAGQSFVNWTGATVTNPNSASTTITMPAANTTVTANFSSGWVDNFESYSLGTFPSASWQASGNNTAIIVNSTSVSPTQSVQMTGAVGGCNAALMYRQIPVAPPYTIQFYARNGNESLSGCHPFRADVELGTSPSWTTPSRDLAYFDASGAFTTDSAGPTYPLLTWVKVRITYELPDANTVRIGYWLNDQFYKSITSTPSASEGQLAWVALASQEGSAWFDDVSVIPGLPPIPIVTTTSLQANPPSSTTGQTVTLTATVSPATASGTVSFLDNGNTIGEMQLNAGTAKLLTSSLAAGTHSLTASYGGDTKDTGSVSPAVIESVAQVTTTALVANPNPSVPGQNVTLMATVTPATATGTVSFFDGASLLGNGPLINGSATLLTSFLAGNHPLTASYGGDASSTPSTSPAVTESVTGPPAVVAVTPASGGGPTQNFSFQFSDPSGYQSLGVVNVLINNFLDGRKACYLAYVVSSSTLVLVDDAGEAGGPYAGSLLLGSSGAIQNSQCAVTLTSAVGSGTTLTLGLNIAFMPAFGGNRIMYAAARDVAQGNSDWQPLGVWQVPFTPTGTIAVTSLVPGRGAAPSGTNQQLALTLTDTKGTGDFGIVDVLINKSIDGRQACYLAYVASSDSLILIDDTGDAGGPYAGSMVLNGGSGSIQNSQCTVSGTGSTVSFAPNTLTLTLNITFKAAFAGNRVIYAAGRDTAGGNNTDWQAVATFTVQ